MVRGFAAHLTVNYSHHFVTLSQWRLILLIKQISNNDQLNILCILKAGSTACYVYNELCPADLRNELKYMFYINKTHIT